VLLFVNCLHVISPVARPVRPAVGMTTRIAGRAALRVGDIPLVPPLTFAFL